MLLLEYFLFQDFSLKSFQSVTVNNAGFSYST